MDVVISANKNKIIHKMRSGIGASWHAIEEPTQGHGGSAWGANPRQENEKQWQEVYMHASWLGLNFIRVEIEQRMYQPLMDKFTFDNYEMKILYRILDWCEEKNADVFIQQMWSNVRWNAHDKLLGDPNSILKSSPKNINAFADGISELLHHLIKIKKYSCIKWICLTNEPGHSWSWFQNENMEPDNIMPVLKCVYNKLKERKIKIPISGPDWTDLPKLDISQIDFDEFIGAYDIHSYNADFDWKFDNNETIPNSTGGYPLTNAIEIIKEWVDYAHSKNKPFFLSEMGSMQFGWGGDNPGPGTFEAGLKDVQTLIRGMNIGVDGFNRWSFINRGNLDGQWQLLDTWDPENIKLLDKFVPHPNVYYLFGLISRLTPKSAEVYECKIKGGADGKNQRVFATFIGNDQIKNLIITNDSDEEYNLIIKSSQIAKDWLYIYQINKKDHSDKVYIDTSPAKVGSKKEIKSTLKAKSLLIYSTKCLNQNDLGIL